MTERQRLVIDLLAGGASATSTELIACLRCPRKEALVTLGIMISCGQLRRAAWTKAGLSAWVLVEQP